MALIGIGFLTLFPFHFEITIHHAYHKTPFLLGVSNKPPSSVDVFLNVLLFIPFGFGIATQLCRRRWNQVSSLACALFAGAITSYLVELVQLYSPLRDSGWDDVFSNSLGSVVGYLIFAVCGYAILRTLSLASAAIEKWLTAPRLAAALIVYLAAWFGVSAYLTRDTRLTNWVQGSYLLVGNGAGDDRPWLGSVSKLQIWNRAIPKGLFQGFPQQISDTDFQGMLASYDFAAPPFVDAQASLPSLQWVHNAKGWTGSGVARGDGLSWLSTKAPVDRLTQEIQKTNQFTVRAVCTPVDTSQTDGRIVSISKSTEDINLHLRQEGRKLVLWFRNPLSVTRSVLAWYVPDVFEGGLTRDIVASYDGADAAVYVDGRRAGIYRLGPGVSFVHRFGFVQTNSLEGYVFVYETLIFFPAGLLMGRAVRKWNTLGRAGRAWMLIGVVLPPIVFELLLVLLSGRQIWPENILFSILLTISGGLLVNSDLPEHRRWQRVSPGRVGQRTV